MYIQLLLTLLVAQNGLGLAGPVVVQNGLSVECGFASSRERGYAVMQIELQPQRQPRHHSAVLLEDEQRLLCRKGEIEPLTDRYRIAIVASSYLSLTCLSKWWVGCVDDGDVS